MTKKLIKGDLVRVSLEIGGLTTYDDYRVLKVTKKGIYLDGLDHPFNPKTGFYDYSAGLGLGTMKIDKGKKQ